MRSRSPLQHSADANFDTIKKNEGGVFIPPEPTCPADAALGVFGSDGCTPVWARLSLVSAALLLTVWNLLF